MLLSIIKKKHGNLYITGSYPPVDGGKKMTTGSLAEWNPILFTSPYPESIMSEDAVSNYSYSKLLNEIDMIWDIDYGRKWEAKAELVTAYFVNVLNSIVT